MVKQEAWVNWRVIGVGHNRRICVLVSQTNAERGTGGDLHADGPLADIAIPATFERAFWPSFFSAFRKCLYGQVQL